MLKGLQNFLSFLNENWTTIAVIIGLLVLLYKKIRSFISKSEEEKIEYAMTAIKETMLKYVTAAELDYQEWAKSGSIKRAQVIDELFKQYPILNKAIDQETIIKMIDEAIDSALPELRKIIEENHS